MKFAMSSVHSLFLSATNNYINGPWLILIDCLTDFKFLIKGSVFFLTPFNARAYGNL